MGMDWPVQEKFEKGWQRSSKKRPYGESMTDRKGHLGILDVLLALAKNGASKENITIAIPDIAEIMGVSTGEFTGSVNRLISSNYLDGNVNQNVGQIRISAKGESILRQAMVD